MLKEVDKFYLEKSEPNRSCLMALRKIILDLDSEVSETQKWGMPCFCYKKQMFCYLWIDKATQKPYILIVEGKLVHHPELEVGKRSRMKIFKVSPTEDLPIKTIHSILGQALALYKDGIIQIKQPIYSRK